MEAWTQTLCFHGTFHRRHHFNFACHILECHRQHQRPLLALASHSPRVHRRGEPALMSALLWHFKSRMFFPVQLAAPACVTRHFPGDGLHVYGHVLSNDGIVVLSRLIARQRARSPHMPCRPSHAHLPVPFPSNLVCCSVHHKP